MSPFPTFLPFTTFYLSLAAIQPQQHRQYPLHSFATKPAMNSPRNETSPRVHDHDSWEPHSATQTPTMPQTRYTPIPRNEVSPRMHDHDSWESHSAPLTPTMPQTRYTPIPHNNLSKDGCSLSKFIKQLSSCISTTRSISVVKSTLVVLFMMLATVHGSSSIRVWCTLCLDEPSAVDRSGPILKCEAHNVDLVPRPKGLQKRASPEGRQVGQDGPKRHQMKTTERWDDGDIKEETEVYDTNRPRQRSMSTSTIFDKEPFTGKFGVLNKDGKWDERTLSVLPSEQGYRFGVQGEEEPLDISKVDWLTSSILIRGGSKKCPRAVAEMFTCGFSCNDPFSENFGRSMAEPSCKKCGMQENDRRNFEEECPRDENGEHKFVPGLYVSKKVVDAEFVTASWVIKPSKDSKKGADDIQNLAAVLLADVPAPPIGKPMTHEEGQAITDKIANTELISAEDAKNIVKDFFEKNTECGFCQNSTVRETQWIGVSAKDTYTVRLCDKCVGLARSVGTEYIFCQSAVLDDFTSTDMLRRLANTWKMEHSHAKMAAKLKQMNTAMFEKFKKIGTAGITLFGAGTEQQQQFMRAQFQELEGMRIAEMRSRADTFNRPEWGVRIAVYRRQPSDNGGWEWYEAKRGITTQNRGKIRYIDIARNAGLATTVEDETDPNIDSTKTEELGGLTMDQFLDDWRYKGLQCGESGGCVWSGNAQDLHEGKKCPGCGTINIQGAKYRYVNEKIKINGKIAKVTKVQDIEGFTRIKVKGRSTTMFARGDDIKYTNGKGWCSQAAVTGHTAASACIADAAKRAKRWMRDNKPRCEWIGKNSVSHTGRISNVCDGALDGYYDVEHVQRLSDGELIKGTKKIRVDENQIDKIKFASGWTRQDPKAQSSTVKWIDNDYVFNPSYVKPFECTECKNNNRPGVIYKPKKNEDTKCSNTKCEHHAKYNGRRRLKAPSATSFKRSLGFAIYMITAFLIPMIIIVSVFVGMPTAEQTIANAPLSCHYE